MLRAGRALCVGLTAGLVLLVLATAGSLPRVVASHFDGANGWSTRTGYAALLITVGALLPLAVVALVTTLTRAGPELLNIPSRDYWRRPEHAAAPGPAGHRGGARRGTRGGRALGRRVAPGPAAAGGELTA